MSDRDLAATTSSTPSPPAETFEQRVLPNHAAPPAATNDADGIPMEGWLFSALIPIVGLVYGLQRLAKGQVGQGLAILIVTAISAVIWLAILAS